MIALANNCLVFRLSTGESIPISAEMLSVELMGDAASLFDPEFVREAAASVFHYFKSDLERESVTVGEFAEALEKVLRGFGYKVCSEECKPSATESIEGDLGHLAFESGDARELAFFQKLRQALRFQLRRSPQMVRFRGLRGCVKHLAGARRWGPRCDTLRDHIVEYIRRCFSTENEQTDCLLLVE